MQITMRTLLFSVTLGIPLVLGLLGLYSYAFLFSDWSSSVKVILVITGVCLGLFCLNWYQSRVVAALSYRLKTTGQDTKEVFSDLYQNSPVPYVRTDKNGKIIHTNAAAVRFFRQTTETLVGQSIFSFIDTSGEDVAHPGISVEQLIDLGHFVNEVEVHVELQDGVTRWAQLSAFPYEHNRERLVTFIDITEEKAVDVAKSEFVSLASHQLRTPISAMLWNLELLQQLQSPAASDKEREYLKKVAKSAQRMNILVDSFLDAAKLEMGTFASKVGTYELNEFLASVTEEFEARIAQKDLQWSIAALPQPLAIVSDQQLMRIIFSNLISNAVKYTPDHGHLAVRLVQQGTSIVFTVKDSGIGIPPNEQSKLFSKLYRATNTKTSGVEGTGLGLYVVKQAVDMLGGTITFVSVPETGTEFTVTLPYQPGA